MKFPRQEFWSGLPFPYPEDLSDPGIEPRSSLIAGTFITSLSSDVVCGGDGIPVELIQILKDDAVKVLHSISQQI